MGRIRVLDFVDRASPKTEVVGLRDFWSLKNHEIPSQPGAYVLVANVWFRYPAGKSPVFYIGQAKDLQKRLGDHLKYSLHVAEDRRRGYPLYFSRYEYAGRFGKSYAYLRTWHRLSPRALEEELMASFARQLGTFPIANGVGSWNRIGKHIAVGPKSESTDRAWK